SQSINQRHPIKPCRIMRWLAERYNGAATVRLRPRRRYRRHRPALEYDLMAAEYRCQMRPLQQGPKLHFNAPWMADIIGIMNRVKQATSFIESLVQCRWLASIGLAKEA